jgi:hypothetical protein
VTQLLHGVQIRLLDRPVPLLRQLPSSIRCQYCRPYLGRIKRIYGRTTDRSPARFDLAANRAILTPPPHGRGALVEHDSRRPGESVTPESTVDHERALRCGKCRVPSVDAWSVLPPRQPGSSGVGLCSKVVIGCAALEATQVLDRKIPRPAAIGGSVLLITN